VGWIGQTVMTEAQLVAASGHWVMTPPQKVDRAWILAEQVVAWIGQEVATVGHWVRVATHWVNCLGHWVTSARAGHTVARPAVHVVAVAGQVVWATGQPVAACGKMVGCTAWAVWTMRKMRLLGVGSPGICTKATRLPAL